MKKILFLGTSLTGMLITAVGVGIRLGNKCIEAEYNEKIEEAMKYSSSLKKSCYNFYEKNKELQRENNNLKQYCDDLSEQGKGLQQDNNNLKQCYDDLSKQNKELQQDNNKLIKREQELLAALSRCKTNIDDNNIEALESGANNAENYNKTIITLSNTVKKKSLYESISNIITDIEVITNQVAKEMNIEVINKKSKKVAKKVKYIRDLVRSSEFDGIRDIAEIKDMMKTITKMNSKYKKLAERRISSLDKEGV